MVAATTPPSIDVVTHPAASPAQFGAYVYGLTPAPHHWAWLRAALDPAQKNVLIIAPAESAKSTVLAEIALAWHIGRYPLATNYLASVSDDQAHERLDAIRLLIEENERWQEVFPHIVPDKKRGWSSDGLHVYDTRYSYRGWVDLLSREGQTKTPMLTAGGVGASNLIGKRLSGWLIGDDLCNDKNTQTKLQRDRTDSWFFRTALTRLTKTGKSIIVGNRWHRDDLPGRIKARPTHWHIYETPAILPDGTSYWAEQWSLERLREKRETLGSVYFRAMYMNDPAGMAGNVFDLDWFKPLPEVLPTFVKVGIFVDLAISQRETADYTAIGTVALDIEGELHILNMRRGHWTFNTTLEQIKQAAADAREQYGRLDVVGIEKVQYQTAAVQELVRTTDLPAQGIPVKGGDKVTRARPVATHAENGHVYAHRGASWWGHFADEIVDFGASPEHDDQVDTLSLAWVGLKKSRAHWSPEEA